MSRGRSPLHQCAVGTQCGCSRQSLSSLVVCLLFARPACGQRMRACSLGCVMGTENRCRHWCAPKSTRVHAHARQAAAGYLTFVGWLCLTVCAVKFQQISAKPLGHMCRRPCLTTQSGGCINAFAPQWLPYLWSSLGSHLAVCQAQFWGWQPESRQPCGGSTGRFKR